MGTVELPTTRAPGETILSQDYNDLRNTLIGDFVGRDNPDGNVEPCQRLGTPTVPWGEVHSKAYYENGRLLDFSSVIGANNLINSGRVRTTSALPDFIRADGSSPSFTLLATDTPLVVTINGVTTTFTADQVEGGLITAPTVNNTAQVNDPAVIGDYNSTLQGENFTFLRIKNEGSEIVNRLRQYIVLRNGTEYLLGEYVGDGLHNVFRGFFFDSSGLPIVRQPLSDNDVLELMSAAWIFVENDASTIDVTYNSPIFSPDTPTSPVVGDYWLDQNTQEWKRYDGASFVVINRTLVGIAVIDDTNCVASRSFNFSKSYDGFQEFRVSVGLDDTLFCRCPAALVDVYGFKVESKWTDHRWVIPTDLEAGQIEANDTWYYAYMTELGGSVLSNIAPYDFRPEIGQFLHPYNSWRYLAKVLNDSSGDFDVDSLRQDEMGDIFSLVRTDRFTKLPPVDAQQVINQGLANVVTFTTAGAHVYNRLNKNIKKIIVELWGAGSGTRALGPSNTSGGTTTFGGIFSASGGNNFGQGPLTEFSGGVGIGGNIINLSGDYGNTSNTERSVNAPRAGAGNVNDINNQPIVTYGGSAGAVDAGAGGAGGYAQSIILDPLASYNLTVGAGGVADQVFNADGQDGLVIVTEYY